MPDDGTALFTLPLEQVLEDRHFNVRIFFGDIDQLAIQLMTEGQHEPIKVRRDGGQFFVVDGHRRQRAFARSRDLRIQSVDGRHLVFDHERPLREAPGPLHGGFDRRRIQCRLVDPEASEAELFAAQLSYNCGKPFTLLERMLFLSRFARQGPGHREELAARTGFSRTHIANAEHLHGADPRLLDCVREGRISQKLALRILRTFSTGEQMARIQAAGECAARHRREKILPKDFGWRNGEGARSAAEGAKPADSVRARLCELVARLAEPTRFCPNAVAQARLETLIRIHRYALGQDRSAELEAFLLGRK